MHSEISNNVIVSKNKLTSPDIQNEKNKTISHYDSIQNESIKEEKSQIKFKKEKSKNNESIIQDKTKSFIEQSFTKKDNNKREITKSSKKNDYYNEESFDSENLPIDTNSVDGKSNHYQNNSIKNQNKKSFIKIENNSKEEIIPNESLVNINNSILNESNLNEQKTTKINHFKNHYSEKINNKSNYSNENYLENNNDSIQEEKQICNKENFEKVIFHKSQNETNESNKNLFKTEKNESLIIEDLGENKNKSMIKTKKNSPRQNLKKTEKENENNLNNKSKISENFQTNFDNNIDQNNLKLETSNISNNSRLRITKSNIEHENISKNIISTKGLLEYNKTNDKNYNSQSLNEFNSKNNDLIEINPDKNENLLTNNLQTKENIINKSEAKNILITNNADNNISQYLPTENKSKQMINLHDDKNLNLNTEENIYDDFDNENDIKLKTKIISENENINPAIAASGESKQSDILEEKKNSCNNLKIEFVIENFDNFKKKYYNFYEKINTEQKICFKLQEDLMEYVKGFKPKIIQAVDEENKIVGLCCLQYDSLYEGSLRLLVKNILSLDYLNYEKLAVLFMKFILNNFICEEIYIDLYYDFKNSNFEINTYIRDILKNKLLFKWAKLENKIAERIQKICYKVPSFGNSNNIAENNKNKIEFQKFKYNIEISSTSLMKLIDFVDINVKEMNSCEKFEENLNFFTLIHSLLNLKHSKEMEINGEVINNIDYDKLHVIEIKFFSYKKFFYFIKFIFFIRKVF